MLRRVAFGFVLALLFVLAMLFTALNQERFAVDFAFLSFDVSSGLALLIAFATGLLAGALVRSRWVAELLAERGRLRQALRLAEARLNVATAPMPATEVAIEPAADSAAKPHA
jgi:uncharacterized integral membrane protein